VNALVLRGRARPGRGRDVADVFYRTGATSAGAQAGGRRAWADLICPRRPLPPPSRRMPLRTKLAVLAAVQRPISPACITVAMERRCWKDGRLVPRGRQDRMIAGETQHFMAERMKARRVRIP